MSVLAFSLLAAIGLWVTMAAEPLMEDERLAEYHRRNYTWPIETFLPNTPGWNALMQRRLNQVGVIKESDQRYDGLEQVIYSGSIVPNFTEFGFGLARCPNDLLEVLQQGIHDGLPHVVTEQFDDLEKIVEGPDQPWFIHRPDLTERVLQELVHYAETWVGLPLTPHQAYGFRLYRNESQLLMHVDRAQTHVISFILHIDHSEDAEPWPIFIEVRYNTYIHSTDNNNKLNLLSSYPLHFTST